MKCPHCSNEIEVRFVKAPPMQSSQPQGRSTDVGELLDLVHDSELETDFEIDFIRQTRERFAQYGDRIRMSEKQMSCLQKIAAK
jgi:hypothetical protein